MPELSMKRALATKVADKRTLVSMMTEEKESWTFRSKWNSSQAWLRPTHAWIDPKSSKSSSLKFYTPIFNLVKDSFILSGIFSSRNLTD